MVSPSLFFLSLVPSLVSCQHVSMPIHRSNKTRNVDQEIANTYARKGWTMPSDLTRKRNIGAQVLGNNGADIEYYAAIQVGTPPVQFVVVIDTGSTSLLLAGAGLNNSPGSVVYDPASSSTSINTHEPFSDSFLDKSGASGEIYTDVVRMVGGFSSGISNIQNISVFNASTNMNSGDSFLTSNLQGLMGLQPSNELGLSFIQNLFALNELSAPEFGLAFSRQSYIATEADGNPGGYLTLGGTNSSLYSGSIKYVPLCPDAASAWKIPLSGITVGTKVLAIPLDQCADIDTGTSLIYLPAVMVQAIYAQIPSAKLRSDGISYTYDCSNVTVGLNFGGIVYNIDPLDFQSEVIDDQTCVGAVNIGGSEIIIGDSFLRNVYTSFRLDPPSVGFATLVDPNQALETNPVPESNSTVANPVTASAITRVSTASSSTTSPTTASSTTTSQTASKSAASALNAYSSLVAIGVMFVISWIC